MTPHEARAREFAVPPMLDYQTQKALHAFVVKHCRHRVYDAHGKEIAGGEPLVAMNMVCAAHAILFAQALRDAAFATAEAAGMERAAKMLETQEAYHRVRESDVQLDDTGRFQRDQGIKAETCATLAAAIRRTAAELTGGGG